MKILFNAVMLLIILLAIKNARADEVCKQLCKAPSSAAIELADEILRERGIEQSAIMYCRMLEENGPCNKGEKNARTEK